MAAGTKPITRSVENSHAMLLIYKNLLLVLLILFLQYLVMPVTSKPNRCTENIEHGESQALLHAQAPMSRYFE